MARRILDAVFNKIVVNLHRFYRLSLSCLIFKVAEPGREVIIQFLELPNKGFLTFSRILKFLGPKISQSQKICYSTHVMRSSPKWNFIITCRKHIPMRWKLKIMNHHSFLSYEEKWWLYAHHKIRLQILYYYLHQPVEKVSQPMLDDTVSYLLPVQTCCSFHGLKKHSYKVNARMHVNQSWIINYILLPTHWRSGGPPHRI